MSQRNYGIDLLRLVLMYMVCLLHTLGQGGLLQAAAPGSAGSALLWLLEVLAYCAVDGFAMISGFTASDRPQKYVKIVDMWFQVFFYSFVVLVIFTLLGVNRDTRPLVFIMGALPVLGRQFWYFSSYFALFFVQPLLNRWVFSLDEGGARRALIAAALLFSCLGVLTDPFKLMGGYSALWLMAIYCMGALARRARLFETRGTPFLLALWALSAAVTWAAQVFLGFGRLANYVSPTIVLNAAVMLRLFERVKAPAKLIAPLAPLAFGVYLFHSSQPVWNWMTGRFAPFASLGALPAAASALGIALAIFLCGLAAEFLRRKLAELIRLHSLSEAIVRLFSRALSRAAEALK